MILFHASAALLVGVPLVFGYECQDLKFISTQAAKIHPYDWEKENPTYGVAAAEICKEDPKPSFCPIEIGRSLTESNVVHYSDSTGTIPRQDVVSAIEAALAGNQNFEVQTNLGVAIAFHDLTRNDMILSSRDLSGEFFVANAFVLDRPEDVYKVICPADGDQCDVHLQVKESQFGSCVLKEDTNFDECLDEDYDLNLYVVGLHFMLGASNSGNCPNIALFSVEGGKHKVVFSSADVDGIPSYSFGEKVTLRDFLNAEEVATPTDNEGFDLESNTCVHYAGSIWRELGYPETHELAQFVVSNVVNDPNFEDMTKHHVGGLRYLVAKVVGGKGAMISHLEEVVYSQMLIN